MSLLLDRMNTGTYFYKQGSSEQKFSICASKLNSAAPIERACRHTSTQPQNISTHLNAINNPSPKPQTKNLKKETLIFKSSCLESIAHSFQLFKNISLLYSIIVSTFRRCVKRFQKLVIVCCFCFFFKEIPDSWFYYDRDSNTTYKYFNFFLSAFLPKMNVFRESQGFQSLHSLVHY